MYQVSINANKKAGPASGFHPSAARLSYGPRPVAFRPLLAEGLALSGDVRNIVIYLLLC